MALQGSDISHQAGKPENHRLKHTLGGDMLVPRRAYAQCCLDVEFGVNMAMNSKTPTSHAFREIRLQVYKWWKKTMYTEQLYKQPCYSTNGNLRVPPSMTPPQENKALLRDYLGTMMVNNPLIRPYFLGGVSLRGVPLDSNAIHLL